MNTGTTPETLQETLSKAQDFLLGMYPGLEPQKIAQWTEELGMNDTFTNKDLRELCYKATIASNTQPHPIRLMMSVSETAIALAKELGIKDFKDFGANMGDIDLAGGEIEQEYENIKELAVTPGTLKYAQYAALSSLYKNVLYSEYGSGYRSPWITDRTKTAFIEFQNRANLPLITSKDGLVKQDVQVTAGAAEGLEKAIASINNLFAQEGLERLAKLRKQIAETPDQTELVKQAEAIEARCRAKTTFIHISPSFSATDKVISSGSILETPQLSPDNGFIIDKAYIQNLENIIARSGNCCLLIEDTPNPLGKRLTSHEFQLLSELMDNHPDLLCIIDHAYIGLAQNEDISALTEFRRKYLERTISVASLSKITASPGKRFGGMIFPKEGKLNKAIRDYYSSSNPSFPIEQEAEIRAQLELLLAGDNEDDIYGLIALALKQAQAIPGSEPGSITVESVSQLIKNFYNKDLNLDDINTKIQKAFNSLNQENEAHDYSDIFKMKEDSKYIQQEVSKLFKARTIELKTVLESTRKFPSIISPENTMYVFAKLPEEMSALEFYLLTGIAAVPGSTFGAAGEGWIRLSVGMLTLDKIREMGRVIDTAIAG